MRQVICALFVAAVWSPHHSAQAASHSDAPLIKQDPQANITDVYAFIGTKFNDSNQKVLNVLVSVRPFSEPGDGVIYDRFADDVLYSIHLTHPGTGEDVTRYDFQFSDVNPVTAPALKNPNTILSYGRGTEIGSIGFVGDARQNYMQNYFITKTEGGVTEDIGSGVTAPPNVGARTTPLYNDANTGRAISGATNVTELDGYTQQAYAFTLGGEVGWAGPRDDGFYADTAAIFDLLDARIVDTTGAPPGTGLGQKGGGVDGFKGYNVLSYELQIPVESLAPVQQFAPFTGVVDVVGVWASTSRRRIDIRRSNAEKLSFGPWVQVSRMGIPLINEVIVPLGSKDQFNRSSPTSDAGQLTEFLLDPELPELLNLVFGTNFATTERGDLVEIAMPDVLKVVVETDPVRLPGQAGFNRLSVIGGDVTPTQGGFIAPSGFPNGRRIGDDVVDILLTVVASGPTFATTTLLGDNVNANDQLYNQVFPYLGTPHAGPANLKDSRCP